MNDPSYEARKAYSAMLGSTDSVHLLDPAYRRKKLWMWSFRQGTMLVLAVCFWEHGWVRWLFAAGVLLALYNLVLLLFAGPYLKRRMERAQVRYMEQEAIWHAQEGLGTSMDERTDKAGSEG